MTKPTADEFIENALSHKYDPVKARAYYLRTRKLKGRKKASLPTNEAREIQDLKTRSNGARNKNIAASDARIKKLRDRLAKVFAASAATKNMPPGPKKTAAVAKVNREYAAIKAAANREKQLRPGGFSG